MVMLVKMLYRKASCLWKYEVIDVGLDDLLQMAHEGRGVILSLNDEKGKRELYEEYEDQGESSYAYRRILANNDAETVEHIFKDTYVITQYDDWME